MINVKLFAETILLVLLRLAMTVLILLMETDVLPLARKNMDSNVEGLRISVYQFVVMA